MNSTWFLVIGALLIFMALASSAVKRLPVSTAMLYLFIGVALGPPGANLIRLDPIDHSALLERITELAVIISLFSAGLKLRAPLADKRWRLPVRIAVGSMVITVGLVSLAGIFLLGLPVGAAILLGAILAPTDPVLASDIHVENPGDRDRVRFGLTGEAGLNDGTAFPFVMLGLGLLGLHELGALGARWVTVDVLWAVSAGIGSGWLLGSLIGRLVIYLRRVHREALGLDEFLALGLMTLSYGTGLLIDSYAFLSVFAAGLAMRRVEHRFTGDRPVETVVANSQIGGLADTAADPKTAPAYMAWAVLSFNEQIERIVEVGVVLLVGGMLSLGYFSWEALGIAALLFLVVRPLSVHVGLIGSDASALHRNLMAWFGIRGIGSIYYLTYAIRHDLSVELAQRLTALVLTVVAASIVVHGVSATPLMEFYNARLKGRRREAGHDGVPRRRA
jgi:NhaP-type Na+/H+ or K+/H+ antiporter